MWFWLIEVPARIIDLIFRAYFIFLAVLTLLSFGIVIVTLGALLLGRPTPW